MPKVFQQGLNLLFCSTGSLALALVILQAKGPPLALPALWIVFAIFTWFWHLKLLPHLDHSLQTRATPSPFPGLIAKPQYHNPIASLQKHRADLLSLNWLFLALFPFGGAFPALAGIFLHRVYTREKMAYSRSEAAIEIGTQGLAMAGAIVLGQWLLITIIYGITFLCDASPGLCDA